MMRKFIRDRLSSLFWGIFRFFSGLMPKRPKLWIFQSSPPGRDNAYAAFEYLEAHHPEVKAIWLHDGNVGAAELARLKERGLHIFARASLPGLWAMLRAKVIVSTHMLEPRMKSRNQIFCNLWHGMPFKSTGLYHPENDNPKVVQRARAYSKLVDYMIATSSLTRAGQAAQFHVPPRQVIITGQPRNDALFRDPTSARVLLETWFQATPNARFILMLPTFRDSVTMGIAEGVPVGRQFEDTDGVAALQAVLEQANAHLIIKPHPLDAAALEHVNLGSRVSVLTDEELRAVGIDLYELMTAMEILITDYSSVYIDFLLLNRPIVYFVPDYEQYTCSREFVFEPFDAWTPGRKVETLELLGRELELLLGNEDTYSSQRAQLIPVFHDHVDAQASQRVVEFLLQESEK